MWVGEEGETGHGLGAEGADSWVEMVIGWLILTVVQIALMVGGVVVMVGVLGGLVWLLT